MKKRAVGITVLLAALAMAYSSPTATGAFCVAFGLVAAIVGARVELDRVGQAAASMVAMIAGVFIARATALPIESPQLLSERTLLLGLPMLTVAAVRACIVRPVYGDKVTLLAALVALTAAGRAQTGLVFPALAALATATGLFAMRASDPSRARLSQLEARHFVGMAFGALTAGALALFATWSLPRVHDAMIARMLSRAERDRTGFSETMSLGSMEGMLQSDAVVLRVRGGNPELLRGVVFESYQKGRWETSMDLEVREVVETPTQPDGPAIEIEYAGRTKNYFLPLGATDVVTSTGYYERGSRGIALPSPQALAKRVWFRQGELPAQPLPNLGDVQLPRKLAPDLTTILESWGGAGLEPRAALSVISERLARDYRYSLDYRRDPGVDPVIDFLRTHKEGHCEYFASAFALLARTARVPARVVAGYRVAERSPLGYAIVREHNAHSWVEVWLDDHWETIDPTPPSELDAAGTPITPWIGAIFDGLRTGWEALDDWFARRSAFQLTLVLVSLVAALVMVRAWRARRGRNAPVVVAMPHELELLARALKRAGIDRPTHETLSALARRVASADHLPSETRDEVTRALERYEHYRYGAEGSRSEALGGLVKAAARLR